MIDRDVETALLEKNVIIIWNICIEWTDRRTDGQTDRYIISPASRKLCMISLGLSIGWTKQQGLPCCIIEIL